ncbi:MAG: IclR family transcriptional regulator [Megasphaera sp.]|jgi:DNA-binding IclR family transcriptional regulator|nr:IclR family transcriptional regulator [Megasphaera sp.]MCH4188450.1 IclR family transcriptional regulator [Megasphaera sp.]MCH4218248.1 IclR family transcriptional regulator [Megasphaera sp.]
MIESIDRALAILQLFLKQEKPLSVTWISKTMGIQKSTVSRTLDTLEGRGFVRKDKETGKFWLGLQIYALGMLFREKEPLQKAAYPYAKALSMQCQAGVHITTFATIDSPYPQHVILEKITSPQNIDAAPPVGAVRPSYCAASGKCLLAFSASYYATYRGCPLKKLTEYTVTDWDELDTEFAAIRRQGYAVEREEAELGMTCIAAPIFGVDGAICAAISVSGAVARITEDRVPEIIEAIKKTASEISQTIS